MRVLWTRGESSVSELQAALPAELAYNSVLTTVRILEQKGYVEHRQAGRAFLYSPTVAERDARRSEVRHVLHRFFENSHERLLLSVLGEGEISADELQRLKDVIAAAEASTQANALAGTRTGGIAAEAAGGDHVGNGHAKTAVEPGRERPAGNPGGRDDA